MAEAAATGLDPAAVEGHNLSHYAQSDANPSRRRRLHLRKKVKIRIRSDGFSRATCRYRT